MKSRLGLVNHCSLLFISLLRLLEGCPYLRFFSLQRLRPPLRHRQPCQRVGALALGLFEPAAGVFHRLAAVVESVGDSPQTPNQRLYRLFCCRELKCEFFCVLLVAAASLEAGLEAGELLRLRPHLRGRRGGAKLENFPPFAGRGEVGVSELGVVVVLVIRRVDAEAVVHTHNAHARHAAAPNSRARDGRRGPA